MTGETITATEAWFRRQGIPHFIEDYNPRRAVFTRGLPFLTVVLFLEVLTVINTEWPWWANALTMIGMIAVVAIAWRGTISLRRRNPFGMPARAGVAQLAVFVLAPSLLTGVVQNLWAIAVWQVLLNLLVLGIVYVTVSFALLPVLGWAVRRLFRDMRDVIGLFARALPLLLLFLTFLFINSEVWNVASGLERGSRNLVIAVFALMGGAFLISRLPAELGQLGRFASAEQVAGLVRGTPVEGEPVTDAVVRLDEPLGRRQWLNAGLVVLFALVLRVLFVSVLVAVFLLALGLAAIDEDLIAAWNGGQAPETLLRLGGPDGAVVTAELLRVALFLATFSGFYFTVSIVTNREYRDEFFEEVVGDVRQAFAVRAVYLGALARREAEAAAAAGASPDPASRAPGVRPR